MFAGEARLDSFGAGGRAHSPCLAAKRVYEGVTKKGQPMKKLVEMDAGDGATILIEVEETSEIRLAGRGADDVFEKAQAKLDEALAAIRPIANAVVAAAKLVEPDEFGVKFGIKLGFTKGIIVAAGSAEANIEVSMKWAKA